MNLGFDGKTYKMASTHQKEWGSKLIAELKLEGMENVLDLGCGDGVLTAQLAMLVPQGRAVGVDFSQSMIETAKQHSESNLSFELLDINQLAYEDMFDVAFSNATLHWIKDHANLLRRVWRALRPGGIIRFNFAADGNCATFNQVIREVITGNKYADLFRQFEWPWYMPKIDDYRVLIGQFTFAELNVWGENADRYFPDSDAMIRWIDQPSLLPFLPYIPTARRETFRAEVIARMIDETRQKDGRCFETFRRIHVFAKKER